MDLQHFVDNFKNDDNIGRGIALYIIASKNLSSQFQRLNFCRCGVAGSREVANIDRSVTASGQASKASSLMSRAAMYLANNIQSMNLIACLILPPSLVNRGADGPTLTRILEKRKEGDARPDFALRGKTMAVALESIYHSELDEMPNVSRARRQTEWFKTTQSNFQNIKLALQSVGHGIYYDFTKFSPTAMPSVFVGKGKKLSGGEVLNTTTHTFRESPRLQELKKAIQEGEEVMEDDGTSIKLDASDIWDIRRGTPRGLRLLELITRKEKVTTATTGTSTTTATTSGAATQTAATATASTATSPPARTPPPVTVRMTRSATAALRGAKNTEEEARRKRIARALAQLAI